MKFSDFKFQIRDRNEVQIEVFWFCFLISD